MEQKNLPELIRSCQAGSRQAQEELVRSVQAYIYFYCLALLPNREEAMDAAQDVLVAMLTGLPSLRSPGAFPGWIRRIIVRTCRKRIGRAWREQQRQETPDRLPETQGITAGARELEEMLDRKETGRIIRELVEGLPVQQRLCVLLYYYDELSVEEIAKLLGVPTGTVKSRLHHARQAIRRGVERYADQGVPLYALSPLPLLGQILREAAAGCLSSAASEGLARAALAAAAGTAGKSVLGFLVSKKALALAGLALACAAAAGSVLSSPPPAPETPPVRDVQPAEPPAQPSPPSAIPADPEERPVPEPELPPGPVLQETAKAKPQAAQGTVTAPPAAPEPVSPEEREPQLPPEPDPLPPPPEPDMGWEEEPYIPVPPDPDPLPESTQPVREPSSSLPTDQVWPARPAPPDPEPADPAPEDPPVPEEPAVYVTERVFADPAGIGGYGFTGTFARSWGSGLPPVEMRYASSDPEVAVINEEGVFTTLSAGTAVLSATQTVQDGFHMRYELTVEVEDHFNWSVQMPDTTLQAGQTQLCSIQTCQWNRLEGYDIQMEKIEWTSSDPTVVKLQDQNGFSCCALGMSPGTASITGAVTFRLDTAVGEKRMEDVCSLEMTVTPAPEETPDPPEVTPDPPEEIPVPPEEIPDPPEETPDPPEESRKELAEFGLHSGYGYQSTFAGEWGEPLPEGLVYSSSDERVVKISGETGAFYTVSAGEAELTAADPAAPDHPYILALRVQDRFEWSYETVEELTLDVGQAVRHGVTAYTLPENTWAAFGIWSVSDCTVAALTGSTYWQDHLITGVRPGTAAVTSTVTFELKTFEGYVRMKDAFSFPVRVVFSELEPEKGEAP